MTTLISLIIATSLTVGMIPAVEPETATSTPPQATPETTPESESDPESLVDGFTDAGGLLDALAKQDETADSLTGTIRFTTINALENDRQQRLGKLAIARQTDGQRHYAVSFNTLLIDNRQEPIEEHYIFDGRWFVERLPKEKQFNKHELVPMGETLDPMELMRDAPYWVSLGHDQDRLLASYDAELLATDDGLIDNADFPELANFAQMPTLNNTVQLKLTPKPGSGFEDDWEWVRIWINTDTLLPVLYIKSEWTGDLQIVELFSTKTNETIPAQVFDTTTPDARSGWHVQISNWRGKE